ncbi:MAG: hypothetical protein H0X62_17480 [Bacteroidetes bacterium]|nr:hypothetical protein [Bacteroidota bacterium]
MNKKIIINTILCAVVAGTVMIALEMILVKIFTDYSIWVSPRKMAAIIMGPEVLKPHTFNIVILAVAMLVHYSLSIIYGFIFHFITARLSSIMVVISGLVFGLALYLINFYGFAEVLFPWFKGARDWTMILGHLAFGFTLGFTMEEYVPKKQ